MDDKHIVYAYAWRRFFALLIDGAIFYYSIFVFLDLEGFLLNVVYKISFDTWRVMIPILSRVSFMMNIAFIILYSPLCMSSRMQGTIGQIIMRISIVDRSYERVSFLRALLRYFCRWLSVLTFYIGFIIALGNPKRLTLHDRLAKTYVVHTKSLQQARQEWERENYDQLQGFT